MAKKQIVSNKTAESAPVSPLIVDNVDALKARMVKFVGQSPDNN